jgi:hypothetical protein
MQTVFHSGEREIQERAGVKDLADRLGPSIRGALPPVARDFLTRQPMAILGFADDAGAVWASILTGKAGFLHAVGDDRVRIDAAPGPGDPLRSVWRDGLAAGTLAIEPASRRRMRVNGVLASVSDRGADLIIREAYANCSKYIQAREWEALGGDNEQPEGRRSTRLLKSQQKWIATADTFFIATRHPEAGADVSHRGGNPGFVHVLGPETLAFPDYAGNNMFNTLGNLAVDPHAGLLFVDFASGDTLQITGEARVLWDAESAGRFAGAQRVVSFRIAGIIHTPGAARLRWRFLEYSPANPI